VLFNVRTSAILIQGRFWTVWYRVHICPAWLYVSSWSMGGLATVAVVWLTYVTKA